jgi:hypothetical protein
MTGYTPTIPAQNNDPADDQPLMLANFGAISTLVDVDHVGFNTTGYGTHEQVTFAANNVPSLPTPIVGGNSQGILFTNKVGAGTVNELFYYAGTTAQSANQYLSAANGSTMTLGGIIIKWGFASITNASQTFASLGIQPFPNSAYVMTLTSTDSALGSPLKVTALSASAFTVTRSGSGATGYYFIAIGN